MKRRPTAIIKIHQRTPGKKFEEHGLASEGICKESLRIPNPFANRLGDLMPDRTAKSTRQFNSYLRILLYQGKN
jgi:hypothetical protein